MPPGEQLPAVGDLRMPTSTTSRPRTLSDTLATIPDLSDHIVKSDDPYCGAGSFSDVYKRQYDTNFTAAQVAVKSFRFLFTLHETTDNNSKSDATRKMIRRELGIWKRLKHPNIVPFLGITYGFGRERNVSLVSVWMVNGTLRDLFEDHDLEGRLTVAHRLRLLLDIGNGLGYLHSFPFVHGDLSCNNVLLDHDYNALLTDFGYTSMVGDIPEAARYLQMTAVRPGAMRWTAPERFTVDAKKTQHSTKSDIYSFGNIALLVLSGRHPWCELERDEQVMVQLYLGNKPKRPLDRPIDDHHWKLIERCWSSFNERPSVEDVVFSLQEFLLAFPSPGELETDVVFTGQTSVGKSSLINMGTPDGSPRAAVVSNDTVSCPRSSFDERPSAEDVETDVALVGQTGVGKSSLTNMGTPDGSPRAAVVSNDTVSCPRSSFDERPSAEDVETDVALVGQTGVGKSSLTNMGTPDGSPRAADVSNDTRPCTLHTISYPRSSFNERSSAEDVFVGRTGVGKSSLINMVMGTPDGSPRAAVVSNDTRPWALHTVSYSRSSFKTLPSAEDVETDVVFVGQTGVGKSSLINMVMGTPDGSPRAADVSNDTRPCTLHTVSYPISLEGGLRCRIWDTRGLNELVGNTDRSLIFRLFDKIRDRQSHQARKWKETLRGRTERGIPILVWCIDATKIEIRVHWQQFYTVFVECCDKKALPAVVITRGPPKGADWDRMHGRCAEHLQGLGLDVEVPFRMVRRYRKTSSVEYEEDSRALKSLVSELVQRSS